MKTRVSKAEIGEMSAAHRGKRLSSSSPGDSKGVYPLASTTLCNKVVACRG